MSKGGVIALFVALALLALYLYARAKADEAVAIEHAQAVGRANGMVGIAGKIVSYILG